MMQATATGIQPGGNRVVRTGPCNHQNFPQERLKHYTCFKLPNLSREDSEAMLWLSELKRQDFIKKL